MDFDAEVRNRLKAARDIAAKAEAENRSLTDEERTAITGHMNEVKDLRAQAERAKSDAALRDQLDALDQAGVGDDLDGKSAEELNQRALKGSRVGVLPGRKTLGQHFTDSESWRGFQKSYPNGVPEAAKGLHIPPVSVPGGLKSLAARPAAGKGLIVGAGSPLVVPDFVAPVPQWYPPMVMRDLVTVGETTSDLIEYAQVSAFTNAAAPVAEATSVATGIKPESSMTFQRVTAPVRTVAHWVPITKRALSDAAQVRTYIDEFLSQGLDQAFESEMIGGDGTGEHFTGILNTTGVQHQVFDTDMVTSLRKALTKVSTVGGTVTGVLMDPIADEKFDLLKDTVGRYYGAGPFGSGPSTVWGRPRVVSYKMVPDKAIVADFRSCVLWDREQASIQLADQHADFFIRNIVALLAEARAAFGILKPQVCCVVDLVA